MIASISGKVITVDRPLGFRHLGELYTIGDKKFYMRAEVGLLTRNIKIVGS